MRKGNDLRVSGFTSAQITSIIIFPSWVMFIFIQIITLPSGPYYISSRLNIHKKNSRRPASI